MPFVSLPSPHSARLLLTGSTGLPKVGTRHTLPACAPPPPFSNPIPFPFRLGVKPSLFPIPVLPRFSPAAHVRGNEHRKDVPAFRAQMALARTPQLRLTAPRALPFPMPTSIVNAGMETAHCKPGLHPFTLMSTPNHPVLPRLRRLPGGILKTPSSFNGLTHARRVAFAAAATVIELADLDTITDFAFPAPVSSGDLYRELRQSIPDVADILPVEDEDVEIVERVPPYTPIAALLVVFLLLILITFVLEWLAGKFKDLLFSWLP
ncbi:hypothetical protein VI817_007979 [Penicillium citrinum]|nr:hypothetical protein VI817_007979 [Penicillium citrinum]